MPLYEYECDACGGRFEIIQRFTDASPETCRTCSKGPVRRLMSSPAIQFKGTGWYITDYSQKGKAPASESLSSPGSEKAERSDKAESKDASSKDASSKESSTKTSDSSSSSASDTAKSTPAPATSAPAKPG